MLMQFVCSALAASDDLAPDSSPATFSLFRPSVVFLTRTRPTSQVQGSTIITTTETTTTVMAKQRATRDRETDREKTRAHLRNFFSMFSSASLCLRSSISN